MTWRSALHVGVAQRRVRVSTSPSRSSPTDSARRRQPRVVRRVLLRGEGVHVAADAIDRLGDLRGPSGLGALEQQVLEEVRHAGQLGRLVTRADADPDARRHRPRAGHALSDDA